MKIFYGVQGTGNGHITRARVMAKALAMAGVEIRFQFTGRPIDNYFDMEIFNDYQTRTGLTFNTNKGQINHWKTIRDAELMTFIKDVRSLDLSGYDLIISDFEPVTAWAAKMQKKIVLGIGHQYAFACDIPKAGSDFIGDLIMKNFAPVSQGIGLHWHHFGQTILPPIITTPKLPEHLIKNKVVVYLPFENQDEVIQCLAPFENFIFHCYAPQVVLCEIPHIIYKPLSRDKFQQDLSDCVGIISNAGFELPSEALQLGKKLLVKPVHGQMEQASNAATLQHLGYGYSMNDLDISTIEHWLHNPNAVQIIYPNVAKIIVQWLQDGMPKMDKDFIAAIWNTVDVLHIQHD